MIFYAPERPVLVNVLEKLGDEDVSGVLHTVLVGKQTSRAHSENHAVKEVESILRRTTSH